jgi:predicted fused transcriptional regulator/phosphomethylpyrimidine kinase
METLEQSEFDNPENLKEKENEEENFKKAYKEWLIEEEKKREELLEVVNEKVKQKIEKTEKNMLENFIKDNKNMVPRKSENKLEKEISPFLKEEAVRKAIMLEDIIYSSGEKGDPINPRFFRTADILKHQGWKKESDDFVRGQMREIEKKDINNAIYYYTVRGNMDEDAKRCSQELLERKMAIPEEKRTYKDYEDLGNAYAHLGSKEKEKNSYIKAIELMEKNIDEIIEEIKDSEKLNISEKKILSIYNKVVQLVKDLGYCLYIIERNKSGKADVDKVVKRIEKKWQGEFFQLREQLEKQLFEKSEKKLIKLAI